MGFFCIHVKCLLFIFILFPLSRCSLCSKSLFEYSLFSFHFFVSVCFLVVVAQIAKSHKLSRVEGFPFEFTCPLCESLFSSDDNPWQPLGAYPTPVKTQAEARDQDLAARESLPHHEWLFRVHAEDGYSFFLSLSALSHGFFCLFSSSSVISSLFASALL